MALYLLDKNKDGASFEATRHQDAVESIDRDKLGVNVNFKMNFAKYVLIHQETLQVYASKSIRHASDTKSTGGFRGKYFVLLEDYLPIDG